MTADLLKTKKNALIAEFVLGNAHDFPEQLAFILDEYLCRCFEQSPTGLNLGMVNNPYTIVALGSYGRKELCIRSDIALLFLFGQTLPDEADQLIKEFVYPLWDCGFEVTHVIRTLDECIDQAEKDVDILVSLLDGRFVCGMSSLFFKLNEALRERVVGPHGDDILAAIVEKNKKRHIRFGDSSYLLEPNLKEGTGGLGDFDAILSMARIVSDLREPRDLEYSGHLSEKEFMDIQTARAFVLRIRNFLHHLSGRKCDQLFMEYQLKIADILEYHKKDGQEPVERFMGDLHSHMRLIKQQYTVFLAERGYVGSRTPGGRIRSKKTRVQGLWVNEKNMLEFGSPEAVLKAPELLVKIFSESASLQIPLSAEARRVVRDLAPGLVTAAYRKSRSVIRAVEKVLLTPALEFNVLDEMVRTGVMECLVPEFNGIVNRIQYNEYHLYPVDKHSLMTVRAAKTFGIPGEADSLCEQIYTGLANKLPLLWACLLHDIGKSHQDGLHSEKGALLAMTILRNLGYNDEMAETVSFLVREHLFLVKMATRRDINDEETAVFCARRIHDESRLNLLFLLTVADSMSTGPKAWNDWTHSLVQGLYLRTLSILQRGEFEPDETMETLETKKNMLSRICSDQGLEDTDFQKFFNLLSLRYMLTVPAVEMADHARLYETLLAQPFVFEVSGQGRPEPRTFTLAAKNKPGLFSKVAGVLTLCGFNILDAQIFTWKNNTALDVFHLSPPVDLLFEADRWDQVRTELNRVLVHDVNLKVRLDDLITRERPIKRFTFRHEPKIEVDNETSGYFTIIEVHADDYPGLLFSITDTLFKCGLDIYVSKIATNMDQVVDIFYVRNLYGEKVHTPEQIALIKTEILRGIKRSDA